MPRTCTVCSNPKRKEIDQLLINGNSIRAIASQFKLNRSSLQRHNKSHILKRLSKSNEAKEIANAENLIEQVRSLQKEALSILKEAKKKKDLKTAVLAINSAKGVLELLGKLLGELNESPQINILVVPEWIKLRTKILIALEPYPEAKYAILKAVNNGST
ncbi:MAG: hypothetical protein IH948_10330 [Bacteroidetes bacterium]|nr:hypothetical protein [Bacteroidota bacterium]